LSATEALAAKTGTEALAAEAATERPETCSPESETAGESAVEHVFLPMSSLDATLYRMNITIYRHLMRWSI
jgi:hypothetical protein